MIAVDIAGYPRSRLDSKSDGLEQVDPGQNDGIEDVTLVECDGFLCRSKFDGVIPKGIPYRLDFHG